MTTQTKEFLTTSELSDRWGVTQQNLANFRFRGTGPVFVKIGGAVRYELADIEAYENAQRFQRTDQRA